MKEQTASVYGLKDPRNDEIFYVGMSTDPYARYGQHLSVRSNEYGEGASAKNLRILEMRKEGLIPELKVIEHGMPIKASREREKYWIRYYTELGTKLTNMLLVNSEKEDIPNNAPVLPQERYSNHNQMEENISSEWLSTREVYRILWPFKNKERPESVTYFARKKFIRRIRNEGGYPMYFHRKDIIKYRDMLIEKGDRPRRQEQHSM